MKHNRIFKFCYILILFLFVFQFSAVTLINQSPRRDSQPKQPVISSADSSRSIKALTKDIIKVLANKGLDRTNYSIAVYSVTNHKFLFQKDARELLVPASTTKYFTAFTALAAMGKDYLVRTSVYTDAHKINNGILEGDIYIVGRGDALLSISDIEFLADQIHKNGINEIHGNIYADGSFFDNQTERIDYSGDKDIVQATQPITALSLEGNIATVLVSSGARGGRSMNVQVIPASDAFKVYIKSRTRNAGSQPPPPPSQQRRDNRRRGRGSLDNNILQTEYAINQYSTLYQQYGDATPEPQGNSNLFAEVNISTDLADDGYQMFTVSGSMDANSTQSYRHYILKPALVVAGALKSRLAAGGVKVTGNIYEKKLESKNPRLLGEFSRPLLDILYIMNKNSDNYLAENVFKMIGAHSGKYESNSKEAREIIHRVLDTIGVNADEVIFNDGSGLSRRNKITTESMVKLLASANRMPFGQSLDSTLPVAGIDGTLRNRMLNSLAENNVHAKTGTHSNVSALAGYVTTLDGEKLAFAFVFNGPSVGIYKSVEDELGKLLSQFFYFNDEK